MSLKAAREPWFTLTITQNDTQKRRSEAEYRFYRYLVFTTNQNPEAPAMYRLTLLKEKRGSKQREEEKKIKKETCTMRLIAL